MGMGDGEWGWGERGGTMAFSVCAVALRRGW